MNLGDGLLFELENGKPRLILLTHAGVGKNPVKLTSKHRAANVLGARQWEGPLPPQQVARGRREAKFKAGAAAPSCSSSIDATDGRSTIMTSSKAPGLHKERGNKAAAKVKTNKHKLSATVGALGSSRRGGPPPNAEDRGGGTGSKVTGVNLGLKDGVVCLTGEQLRQILSTIQTSSAYSQPGPGEQTLQGGQNNANTASSVNEGEEREIKEDDEGRVEERQEGRADETNGRLPRSSFSWLDERQPDSRAAIHAKKAQWKRELDEQVALKQQLQQHSAPSRLQVEEYPESVSSVGHREQPAAIRSSLRLGEEALSVERKEEQRRRWLEELDRQREETAERRKREELLRRQTEDHERWAAHFDSLQRRAPIHPPVQLGGSEREDWDPSSSLSLVWEATSSCGAESVIGTSADSTRGFPSRSSYLRTMTSLLDPAQLEERERRRLKQLEQQRAIEAQMEERRKQREQEEARRRREEEEEEKRVALEREKLLKQHEVEMLKKKKEKKDPVPQKEPDPQAEQLEDGGPEETSQPRAVTRQTGCVENGYSSSSFYRDSSVQTEDTPPPPVPLAADRVETPDVSVQNHPPPSGSDSRSRAAKKNVGPPAAEDLYELFASTERSRRTKRRPEWNTQRPSRRFVPASERYPVALQKNRQESRMRRQAELLALQERTRLTRTEPPPQNQEARLCPNGQRKVDSGFRGQNQHHHHTAINTDRGRSPPVPAIKPGVQTQPASSSPPPALEFVPYLRTAEVFSLDPLEPADTPPPRTHPGPPPSESSPSPADPLLHPEVLRNSQRQQEILRGLAQLRQGLLQKRRELETDLNRRNNERRAVDGGGSTAELIGAAK